MNIIENTFDCSARLTALDEQFKFVAAHFSRTLPSLYKFLGECHTLVLEIGGDGARVQSLNDALAKTSNITDRERKRATTVAAKVVLYVFRTPDGDLSNRSTRSNYKRAIQKAIDKGMSSQDFVSALTKDGVVAFIAKEKAETSESAVSTVEIKRQELLANTIPSMKSIGLIGNKNPADTFAVVVYRVDGGHLVPCCVTDDTRAVNSLLTTLIPLEKARIEKEADMIAAEARRRHLQSKKAA